MNFNIFGKKDQDLSGKNVPYIISTEMSPYRLYANKPNSLILFVKIKNVTKDALLTSIEIKLPQKLGMNENMLLKEKRLQLGEIEPRKEKETKIEIFGNINTDVGEYSLTLSATSHFRDYQHVVNRITKPVSLKVIK
ncbi:MAG: hypothetical protein M1331_02800 [Candidatus Marsarchaeota archaeon]|nr:hypothetical protein [Candidatus Marsarchaeota archaeon]MCL5106296.1 hypothetical protein [Candidatus Marsarchaeota archaeon]